MNRPTRVNPVRRLAVAAAGTLLACVVATGSSSSHAATVKKADDTSLAGPLVALENGAAVFDVKPEKGNVKPKRTPVPLADIVEITIDPATDARGAPAPAVAAEAPVPRGPVNLFDGTTLKGWEGDADVWSVRDGVITGAVTDNQVENRITFLTHTTAKYGDFELAYSFRIVGGQRGASGVQFRSAVSTDAAGHTKVMGYQQDLDAYGRQVGMIFDSGRNAGGQPARVPVGSRVVYKADGTHETTPLSKSADELNALVKPGEWNQAVVVAKGNTMVSMINGVVFAVLVNETADAPRTGSIAFELRRHQTITAEFKDVTIRSLAPSDVPNTPGVTWEPAKTTTVAETKPATEAPKVAVANAAAANAAAAAAQVQAAAVANAGADSKEKASAGGKVVKVFDGKTLKGWEGDDDIWSVQDGVITGKVDENVRNSRVTYLTYTAEEFSDFQISYSFKVVGGQRNSGGLQFRSKVVENGDVKDVAGYQQDWGHSAGLSGQIVDSGGNVNGQPLKASVGERVTYDAQGNRSVAPLDDNAAELNAKYKEDDWNEATLVVRGNHMVSMINGHIFAEAINQTPNSAKKGVIAFQISRRQLMTIQIKDLSVRKLGPKQLPNAKGVDWAKVFKQTGGGAAVANGDETKDGSDAEKNAKQVTAAWQVRLAGGDQVSGELLGWDDKVLRVKTSYGELSIPVKQLREVWHGSNDEIEKGRAAARSAGNPAAATQDTAFARKDDQVIPVNGLVRGATKDSLNFRFQDQDKQIKFEKLVGVSLAVAGDPGPDDSLQQSLVFPSGDVVSGQWTALENGTVTLKTNWGDTLKVPVRSFERIRTKNGRLVFLSDLTPASVEQTPYFDRMLAYRTDKSLTGGPIKLSDGEHAKGLSVHSRTVLRYDIGRKYETFRAKLGFQQPEGKSGRVAVRVLGDDGKVLREIPDARGDQPPVDLDLNVSGVSRLTLVVDFGADQDVGDRFVWADARLLRANATK